MCDMPIKILTLLPLLSSRWHRGDGSNNGESFSSLFSSIPPIAYARRKGGLRQGGKKAINVSQEEEEENMVRKISIGGEIIK